MEINSESLGPLSGGSPPPCLYILWGDQPAPCSPCCFVPAAVGDRAYGDGR